MTIFSTWMYDVFVPQETYMAKTEINLHEQILASPLARPVNFVLAKSYLTFGPRYIINYYLPVT